jgi:Rps23 Pro-64 3,4-dihydroxylase Tpa1-like proline 4-hydroxylase
MKISGHRVNNLSYILINDFFTAQELDGVTQEVKDLKRFALCAEKTGVAMDDKQTPKKTGTGLFLDELYINNREASDILTANRKMFASEIQEYAAKFDIIFEYIKESNQDTTLLNYYVEGQKYAPHKDNARISSVTFLREGDFKGGEFSFPEQDVTIDALHNRTVIFPSCTTHSAMPVHGNGTRISIAQFIDRTGN